MAIFTTSLRHGGLRGRTQRRASLSITFPGPAFNKSHVGPRLTRVRGLQAFAWRTRLLAAIIVRMSRLHMTRGDGFLFWNSGQRVIQTVFAMRWIMLIQDYGHTRRSRAKVVPRLLAARYNGLKAGPSDRHNYSSVINPLMGPSYVPAAFLPWIYVARPLDSSESKVLGTLFIFFFRHSGHGPIQAPRTIWRQRRSSFP